MRGGPGVAGIKMPCGNSAKNESVAGEARRWMNLINTGAFCVVAFQPMSLGTAWYAQPRFDTDRANRVNQHDIITDAVRDLLGDGALPVSRVSRAFRTPADV